jgi:hypothetical protein
MYKDINWGGGNTKPKAWYIRFDDGNYPRPDQRSLFWIIVNEFIDSR